MSPLRRKNGRLSASCFVPSKDRRMFITIEGGDGTGKSTQVQRLAERLAAAGYDVVACRDPGSTPLGEAVRELILHRLDIDVSGRAEMLLYMAARAQLVDEVVRPALEAGKMVVSDRFLLSNVVYQGYGGGLDIEALWQVGKTAIGDTFPDLVIVLDLEVEQAMRRIGPSKDRLERRGLDYHRRVREGFLHEAERLGESAVVLSAADSIDAVHDAIWQTLLERGLVHDPA
ncbi:MAG: dTMP kinase [Planctomycetota bacterium]|nr:MAG: dTMP kinase [Planctomycetota bacterium]